MRPFVVVVVCLVLAAPCLLAQSATSLEPAPPDLEIGHRIPLILIHGWRSSPATWESFLDHFNDDPELQRYFKPYLFEYHAGMTDSYVWRVFELGGLLRSDLQSFYEWKDPWGWSGKPMVILAHSMGGVVARSFMQRHWFHGGPQGGELVARLITLATPHHGTPVADVQGDAYVWRLSGLGWDKYDGRMPFGLSPLNVGLRCINNYENLGRMNADSCPEPAAEEFARRGFYDRVIAYGSTATLGEIHWELRAANEVSSLAENYPDNDGIIPIQSALFDDWPILARRRSDDQCDHYDIVKMPLDQCRFDGALMVNRVRQDLIESIPCTDAYEPNDSMAAASGPIAPSTAVSGRHCRGLDDDWFRIDLAGPGTLALSLAVPEAADYDLELYSGSTLLGSSVQGLGIAEQLTRTVAAGGTYRVRVFKHSPGTYNLVAPYTLTYTFAPTTATPPAAPTLVTPGQATAPGAVIDTRSPLFRWQSVPGADSYRLELSDAAGVVLLETIAAPAVSWTPQAPLADNRGFRWRMQARNAAGWGAFGGSLHFSTYTGTAARDFSVGAEPSSGTAAQGMTASFAIRTATVAGDPQTVTLDAGALPAGVTASITPQSVLSGTAAVLTVTVAGTAAPGSFTVPVTATGSTGTSRSAAIGFTVHLAPSGGEPAVCFDRTSVGFSDQTVGTSGPLQTVAVRNCGNGPLHIRSYGASLDFYLGGGSFPAPIDLPVDTQTTFQVGFAPFTAGPRTGTVRVHSNAPGSPAVLPLSGTAIAAPVTTGTVAVNATMNGEPYTGSYVFSVTAPNGTMNYGTLPLTLTERPAGSYTVAAVQPPPGLGTLSSITPAATQTLAAGSSVTFTMNFTGTNEFGLTSPASTNSGTTSLLQAAPGGSASATLRASYMRGGNQTITYSVTGIPGGVAASVSPSPASLAQGTNTDSTLSVSVGAATVPGVYRLRVEAANQDGAVRSLIATLVVPRTVAPSLVSISSAGAQGNDVSLYPSISGDGRSVAWYSPATNLSGADANNAGDSFVRDLLTGATTRISLGDDGSPGNDYSPMPSISDDGRWVAFRSQATNLVGGTQTSIGNIYVRDRVENRTLRVSLAADGAPANGECLSPSISADGRYVAFTSNATNLAPGTTAAYQVYLRDVVRNETVLISRSAAGAPADQLAYASAISADGRYVAFISAATNLVPGATASGQQLFIADRVTGQLEVASGPSSGVANGGVVVFGGLASERGSSLSPDGRFVAFISSATNLVSGVDDRNFATDVFLRDRKTGTTSVVSVSSDGVVLGGTYPVTSADGRYVVFLGRDPYLGLTILRRDVYAGRTEGFAAGDGAPVVANGEATQMLALSSNGRTLAFSSAAANLVAGDANARQDIFAMTLPAASSHAQSLAVSPAAIPGGGTATATITLSAPAPAGGATVQLTSSDEAVQLPAAVTIPAGATSASFNLVTLPVEGEVRVSLVASYGGGSPWALVTVDEALAARIETIAGAGQTAAAGAALPVALQALVLDAANNPLPGVEVRFTAPASGPSGTFAGGTITAVATTNASGIATAPQFTVGQQTGAMVIVASTAGVDGQAVFPIAAVIGTPSGVVATAASTTTVFVTWAPVPATGVYHVHRRSPGTSFAEIGTSETTGYVDTTAVPGTSYLYAVVAGGAAGGASALSAPDLATTILFTGNVIFGTPIRAIHVTELRAAVNAVRTLAGFGAASLTDPGALTGVPVRSPHVTELRAALAQARAALGLPAMVYTRPAVPGGQVAAADVVELRNATR